MSSRPFDLEPVALVWSRIPKGTVQIRLEENNRILQRSILKLVPVVQKL